MNNNGGYLYVDTIFSLILIIILSGSLSLSFSAMKRRAMEVENEAVKIIEEGNNYHLENEPIIKG